MAVLLSALLAPTAVAQTYTNIPVFQFGVFYNPDLDFSPGQALIMNGKVHCNGTIWMCPQALATFNDVVEASMVVTNKDNPNDQQNLSFTSSNLKYVLAGQPVSHVDTLSLPIKVSTNISVETILNLPSNNIAIPSDAGYQQTNQIYLYNGCDLIISNASTGINGNSRYGTNLSVFFNDYYLSSSIPTNRLVLCTNDVQWISNANIVTNPGPIYVTNKLKNCYYSFLTNVTFYDFREGKTVQAVQFDVAKFNIWMTNHLTRDATNTYVAGYRWNYQLGGSDGAHGDKGRYIDSVYIYNNVPLSSTTLPAVRVINGQQLPTAKGLTIATPMPLYLVGDYNTTQDGVNFSKALGNTTYTYPAALMGDSITILSSSWKDTGAAYQAGGSYSSRNATSTYINAACLEGIVVSTNISGGASSGKRYSGGLENFLRLLEDWGGDTLTYNGSIVVMFPSIYATNYWQGPNNYYGIPTRAWGFDANFLNISKLPPLTPMLGNSTNPPVITAQPQSQTITSGNTAVFTVTASGSGPLAYQWSFNGTNIAGATKTSLTLTNVQFSQAGTYRVQVTNAFGSTLSSNALLTVTATPPSIQIQPTNRTVFVNDTATFIVTASGSLPLCYQWSFNGANLDGATNATLILANVQTNQAGNYLAQVTNAFGSTNSTNAVLTVVALTPSIQTQPTDQTATVGDTVVFKVTASGFPPLSYQWNFNGTNLDGATNSSFTLAHVQMSQAGNYTVRVTNAFGSIMSTNAILTMSPLASCVKPPNGLVAWWQADGNAFDRAGTNDGVVQSITYTNGMVGQAFACNGSGRVQIADSPAFQLTNALTIECWIRPRGNGNVIFWRGDNRSGMDPYLLGMQGNNNLRFYIEDASGNAAFVGTNLDYNQWYYVAATWDGASGMMNLYINGQLAGQTNTTIRPFGPLIPGDNPAVGIGNIVGGNFPFVGDIDEVSLYSRVLTTDEIQFIYNAESSGECVSPPTIIEQPTNQTAVVGGNTAFGVTANGSQPLSYQWQFNGTNLNDATNATLTLNNVTLDQAGNYAVQVSNLVGSVLSSNAVLTLAAQPPTIQTQPTDQTISVDGTATFNVTAAGSLPLSYQWNFNGTNIDGATNASLTLTSVQMSQAGNYAVQVTNAFGSTNSANAVLTVVALPPTIQKQPTNQTVFVNGSAIFSVTATGSTPLSYQWNFNGTNIDGATNASLTLTSVQMSQAGNYAVQVTNLFGSMLSSNAVLTVVGLPPTISSQPTSQTVIVGGSTVFNVTAAGSWPLSYQWQFNGTDMVDATNLSLMLDNVRTNNEGSYQVIVTNAFGSVTSSVATLTVASSLVIAWGENNSGQSSVPAGLASVVAIAAGAYHSLALQANGTVVPWGYNFDSETNVPVGLTNVVAIAAGAFHSLALQADGTLVGWGSNSGGQINIPPSLTNVVAIAAGALHSLALQANGTVLAWGYNDYGQTSVPGDLTNVVAIAAGGEHSVALLADGTVVTWGDNSHGQLNMPAGLTNIVAITAGEFHSLALQANGTVVGWGYDIAGETQAPAGLTNVVAIAAGDFFSLALQANGTVVAWGDNFYGEINIPASLTNVVAIAAGGYHSLALENDGSPVILRQPRNQTAIDNTTVRFNVTTLGRSPLSYQWSFNGTNITGATDATLTLPNVQYSQAGSYAVSVTNAYGLALSSNAMLTVNPPSIHLVSLDSTNPVVPYLSWDTAATNIQDAIDAASDGDQVLVTNGVYQTGGRVVYGSLTNRVVIDKAVTVQSANGPAVTVIQGYQVPGTTFGDSAVRCVYLTNGASLVGFTLTRGATRASGDLVKEQCGGGVWSISTSTLAANLNVLVSNCVLIANAAHEHGGGASYSILNNCILVSNSAGVYGGGAYVSTLNDCIVSNNTASQGGGSYGISVNGQQNAVLNNCFLTGNSAQYGGGTFSGVLYNCTVTGNSASSQGGGAWNAAAVNSILYYNAAPNGANWFSGSYNFCCTTPIPGSNVGTFTNAPLFVNQAGGDFHLQASSPCINSGNNASVIDSTDLDGNPRISGGTVDIGLYEFQNPASILSYAWAQHYGLPTDGSADLIDSDGDGMNNWQEWIVGTDPTDSSSLLTMTAVANDVSGITITWQSVSGVTYFLQCSTNLGAQPAFSTIQSNIAGQTGTTSYTDTTATNGGPYFYRVGVP